MRILIVFFTLILSAINVYSQKDPYKIIDQLKLKFQKVKDYETNARIKIDVNFLKVPEAKAKIFFKKPDKIKMESEGFAMLPKEGLNFLPDKFLGKDITAIYTGTNVIDEDTLSTIKIIPNNDSSKVVLSKLWIDEDNSLIRKVETTTKKRGTFTVELFYGKQISFGLPDSVILSFNVNNVPVPNSITGEVQTQSERKRKKRFSGPMVGKVKVYYSDYKINVGLSDELFIQEEGSKVSK